MCKFNESCDVLDMDLESDEGVRSMYSVEPVMGKLKIATTRIELQCFILFQVGILCQRVGR